ncbi:MAG: hypothetical protein KIS69_13340 [Bacteroidetes bacterium]|nr:hypothetical protein [Bacteroidota bacterium]MCW5931557.1 hypothetical protein [Bacteroidota bacterium]MCW5932634.1 hypothetical protein [Bacteroidota bacterium]
MDKKIIQKTATYFADEEKHKIIHEYIATGCTKEFIWRKYTGNGDHGQLLRWMVKFGYLPGNKNRTTNIVSNLYPKAQMKKESAKPIKTTDTSFENLQLKRRIAELEKQLKEAELKAIAFSTMVDIAEKEFKIPIRKKYNTKP